MKKHLFTRILSMMLAVVLLCGVILPVSAVQEETTTLDLPFTEVENSESALDRLGQVTEEEQTAAPVYEDTQIVRVSVIMEERSTMDKGFSLEQIAVNEQAMAYRAELKQTQAAVTEKIEVITGTKLDVVWNLTLTANAISANVAYGDIEAIEAIDGVKEVVLENRYEPAVVDEEIEADPNMATSGGQIGSSAAWASGYTGLGSRIAVIDTGIDTDHQSFAPTGLSYSLAHQAGLAGMDVEEYIGTLNLLTVEEIESVRDQLNVPTIYLEGVTKDLLNNVLTVTASDNQYIAAITVSDLSGKVICTKVLPEQTEAGQTVSIEVDMNGYAFGKECLITLGDYAGNEAAYTVDYGGEEGGNLDAGEFYAYTSTNERVPSGQVAGYNWYKIDPTNVTYDSRENHTGTESVGIVDYTIRAAEYVGGFVFMAGTDGNFYVARHGDWENISLLAAKPDDMGTVRDMAFNYADGKMYMLVGSNKIYTLDLGSGETELSHTLTITNPRSSSSGYKSLSAMTIDDEGNFYAVNYGSSMSTRNYIFLYSWSLDDVVDGTVTNLAPVNNTRNGYVGIINVDGNGTMAWDHDNDKLYMAGGSGRTIQTNYLVTIDTTTGKATKTTDTGGIAYRQSLLQDVFYGLYVIPSNSPASLVPAADGVSSIILDQTSKEALVNTNFSLSATVGPWNLSDQTVNWSSSDEAVAVVDQNGVVTTVGVGEAVITATTNAEPKLSAQCAVTVSAYPATNLSALSYDADGNARWVEFNTDDLSALTLISDVQSNYLAGGLHNGMLYVHNGSYFHSVDAETLEVTNLGYIASSWLWSDASTAPETMDGSQNKLIAICNDGLFIELLDPELGTLSYFDMSSQFTSDPMATIAYAYTEFNVHYYYVITESGVLYMVALSDQRVEFMRVGQLNIDLLGAPYATGHSKASMIYDGATGYLLVTYSAIGTSTTLYAVNPDTLMGAVIGEFGEGVAPVVSLYQFTRTTELTVYAKPDSLTLYPEDERQINARVLPNSYDGTLIWSSADPAVATVDENGLVVGIAPGETVITATSVAVNENGETASMEIPVTVRPLYEMETEFHGQAITEDGSVQWITVNANDLSSYSVDMEADTAYSAVAAHDSMLYAMQPNAAGEFGQFIIIDPENGYDSTNGSLINAAYLGLDATTAPAMMDNRSGEMAWGMPVFINSTFFLMMEDCVAGTANMLPLGVLTNEYRWAAVAFFGRYDDDYWNAQGYYGLTSNGTLYIIQMRRQGSGYMWNVETVANLGIRFDDAKAMTMTYLNDGIYTGLLLADSSGENTRIYFVDMSGTVPELHRVGTMEGVVSLEGIYTDYDMTIDPDDSGLGGGGGGGDLGLLQGFVPGTETTASSPIAINMDRGSVEYTDTANAVVGSTNAAAAECTIERPVIAAAVTGAAAEEDGVVVTVSEDVDVTNGLITVTYDPAALTYMSVTSAIGNTAVNVDEVNGVITFAYATANAITAGDVIAAVNFAYAEEFVDTTVTVETLQRNDTIVEGETVTEEISYEVGGHSYEITDSADADCETDGYVTYTCSKCGHSYTDILPATGHSFGEWVVDVEPDCFTDGQKTRVCPCGEKETEVIPASADHCPSAAFTDLDPAKWYHEGIDFALEAELMYGVSSDKFDPNGQLTRAQLVTILYRLAGTPDVTELENPFEDVAEDTWYTDAVVWAADAGVVYGITETTFAPDSLTTREQIVTILYRYAGAEAVEDDVLAGYADADSVSSWAYEAMNWAVAEGIISGMSETTLAPRSNATRAQFAAILMRFAK